MPLTLRPLRRWMDRVFANSARWATLICVVGLGAIAKSPVTAQDVQVPFDRDSTLYVVDADLRQSLGLFPEVAGFQEARLYRTGDGGYEIVIRYERNGRALRERRSLTRAEVETLRERVTEGLASTTHLAPGAQAGRYDLIAATTIHGFIEGGLLAGAVDMDGEEAFTTTLLGGAAGFFVPLFATRRTPVSEAEADMVFYGGGQGYLHAVEVMGVLAGEDLPGRGTAGLAALGGAVEGALAYRVARRNGWTAGHAEMVSATGFGGNLVGFGLGAGLVGELDEPGPEDENGLSRVIAGTALLGSLGGAYLGHRMGRTGRYTAGDARIYALSAYQGANLLGSFLTLQDDPSPRASALLLTGSAVGGAVLGRSLVHDRDFTGTQGSLVGLGSLAGTLLGVAITAGDGDGESAALVQALGSAAGFGLTYAVLEGDARRQATGGSTALDLNLHVRPTVARTPSEGRELVPRAALEATF